MGDIFPYRNVAAGGVVTDVEPFALPLGTWSMGVNVRFRNNSVTRGPVFRNILSSLAQVSPRFMGAFIPSTGFDQIVVGYLNGKVSLVQNASEADATLAGYTPSNSEDVYTSCQLNDIVYVNRGDRNPWMLSPSSSVFVTLPNWAPVSGPWEAQILRTCNSALIALNVTQNGTSFGGMVLTSEFANGVNAPTTWNYTLGTNNATQNTIDDIKGGITEACPLGNQLIIYGLLQTYRMFLTGDDNIWGIQPLFSDAGCINQNCAVEVDRKQYVFGLNDIWVHDGNSKVSICDEKTREFIFNGLSVANASRCGVMYNPILKELYFRYMSSDAFTTAGGFPTVDGCNRQATFHIPTSTWSFDDLPYIFGQALANTDVTLTWASDTRIWSTAGGSWAANTESEKKVLVMLGDANTQAGVTESVYAFDLQGVGSLTTFPVNTSATKGSTLIRDGIDLKEIKKDLRGYATIHSIYPQMVLEAGANPAEFTFATSDFYGQPVIEPGITQTYDGDTLYKLDFELAGRFLSMTMQTTDFHYFNFTGLDLDLDVFQEF